MRFATWAVAALLFLAAWRLYSQRDIERPAGMVAASEPRQQLIEVAPGVEHDGFLLRPRAELSATVRILSRKDYSAGDLAGLVPTDFAVGWGPMSDSANLRGIQIQQRDRFYYWRTETWPLSREVIQTHSANWHVIAGSEAVGRVLGALQVGSVVELRGQLVDVQGATGNRMTSLSRGDTGAGACEILLASSARIVEPH